ncbi:MAG: Rrf2 family transcriptional regulator [Weeksellaceae bacterium]|jgi:Rrf2 family protein|nr:Rrf2 family transcriptional regulator [Weeksellaceae bacterium]MDX9704540.1 Rrf2 family transcriptional regulator [Weeksellaceae bacterium]
MLSNKTKYGIKALVFLCRNQEEGPLSISKIAENENIPHKFLESILLILKKKGILASKKGKKGGYYLLKKPNEIMMTDVFRLLNGPIAMFPCASLNYYEICEDCPDEVSCTVNHLLLEIRNQTLAILRNKSLSQLADETPKFSDS